MLGAVGFLDPPKSCKLGCRTHSLSSQRRRTLPDHNGTAQFPQVWAAWVRPCPLWGDRLKVRTLGRTQGHPFIWAVLIPRAAKPIRSSMLQKMRVAGTGPAHLFSFHSCCEAGTFWFVPILAWVTSGDWPHYRNNRQMSPGLQEHHYGAKRFWVFCLFWLQYMWKGYFLFLSLWRLISLLYQDEHLFCWIWFFSSVILLSISSYVFSME